MRNYLVGLCLGLASFACSSDGDSTPSSQSNAVEKPSGKTDAADVDRLCAQAGKGPNCDLCEAYSWYDDGACDRFCLHLDPDCGVRSADTCGRLAYHMEDICLTDPEVLCYEEHLGPTKDNGKSYPGFNLCCVPSIEKQTDTGPLDIMCGILRDAHKLGETVTAEQCSTLATDTSSCQDEGSETASCLYKNVNANSTHLGFYDCCKESFEANDEVLKKSCEALRAKSFI